MREMYDGVAATAAAFTAAAAAAAAAPVASGVNSTAAAAAAAAAINASSWFYTRPVRAKIHTYECRAPSYCPACGPGLLAPADNCTSAACPGANDAGTANCSGRGLGIYGGCTAVEGYDSATFECDCGRGEPLTRWPRALPHALKTKHDC